MALLLLPYLVLMPGMEASGKRDIKLEGTELAMYDSLRGATLDEERSFAVRPGAVWSTDLGDYHFESGTITFFTRVAGHPTGCLFRGEAQLIYRPPSAIERHQLARFCGDTVLSTSLEEAYIRFFDNTINAELMTVVDSSRHSTPKGRNKTRGFEKNALKDLFLDFGAQGWELLTNGGTMLDWLYISPVLRKQRRMHFLLDERQEEAVSVWRRPGGAPGSKVLDLVCSYDRDRSPEDKSALATVSHGGIDIDHYDSRVSIDGAGRMDLDVQLTCRARRTGQVIVSLALAPTLDVDSIRIADVSAPYVYDDKGGQLLAQAPHALHAGDTVPIRLWYRGKHLLEKLPWGDFYIRHTTRWLPKTAPRRRATYTTRFESPEHYEVVSVGQQVSDTVMNDRRVSTWETFGPESYISFNYGSFEKLIVPMEDGPELRIYRGKNHLGGLFSGDFKKTVAANIEGAVRLFSEILVPYPWDHLAATEIPGSHGQGFPQLLHLAWISFQSEQKGITDAFRAHEVAHQWFGHIVGWRTYHDQWLSEAFAEYAGALYLQARHPGNREFFEQLKQWRRQVLEKGGRTAWHDGPQVAPIWLGHRCASYRSPASYHNIVYAKGAYVLHMLRQMLHEYEIGSDQQFFWMLSDFVDRFSGRDASTEDFRRVVESHFHQDMGWFFDQWIYGTQIPRFEYQWDRFQFADGTWAVRGRIDQFDTSPPFRAYLPITVEFDEGRKTVLQEIDGATTSFEIAPLNARPKNVRFNDFHTVLCHEKVVGKP